VTVMKIISLFAKCLVYQIRLIFFHSIQFSPNESISRSDQREPFFRWPKRVWQPGYRSTRTGPRNKIYEIATVCSSSTLLNKCYLIFNLGKPYFCPVFECSLKIIPFDNPNIFDLVKTGFVEWGSEYQTFKYRNYSISGQICVWFLNGCHLVQAIQKPARFSNFVLV
jgi:hypothetical protein